MNKKGQFFLQWGTDRKQEQLFGIKLNLKCSECKSNKFNIIYNLKRYHLFWIIPLGRWSMDEIYIQCLKCGKMYLLEDKLKEQAIDIYAEVKVRQELTADGKVKEE